MTIEDQVKQSWEYMPWGERIRVPSGWIYRVYSTESNKPGTGSVHFVPFAPPYAIDIGPTPGGSPVLPVDDSVKAGPGQ